MLVLSRHKNEAIDIQLDESTLHALLTECAVNKRPQRITLTVVEIKGDKVRIGVVASAAIPVHRQEVRDAIDRETGRGYR